MQTRKKRSLLARIEGRLAALGQDPSKRRRIIQRAVSALAALPLDAAEAQRLTQLQQHLAKLLADDVEPPAILLAHRNTLARMDCLLWQFYLNRADKSVATPVTDEAA